MGKPKPFRTVTMNICYEPSGLIARLAGLVKGLIEYNPDLICLQEVFSPTQRIALDSNFHKNYHIIKADHHIPAPPPIAWLFSPLFFGITLLLSHLGHAYFSILFFFLSILFIPRVLLGGFEFILRSFLVPSAQEARAPGYSPLDRSFDRYDLMGTAVLARRSMWEQAELVQATEFPFDIRGYLPPDHWSHFPSWFQWWLRMTLIRPGFILVRLGNNDKTELLVLNNHLTTGVSNPERSKQVRFMLDAVNAARKQFDCDNVVWCGDFNAHHDEPEHDLLRKANFVDCVAALHPDKAKQNEFITWDNSNHLVAPGEPDQRIDFVWHSVPAAEAASDHSGASARAKQPTMRTIRCQRLFDKKPFASDHYGIGADIVYELDD